MAVTGETIWRLSDELPRDTASQVTGTAPTADKQLRPGPTPLAPDSNSVIRSSAVISGSAYFGGSCELEGTIDGELTVAGKLILRENSVVNAKILAHSAEIFGRVIGDIDCEHRLALRKGASVNGNITTSILVIDDGVAFEGHCSMRERTESNQLSSDGGSGLTSEIEPRSSAVVHQRDI